MENNNRKGMFYGIIGVATLLVAIIGATYAYFSVTQQSADYMYGSAATAGLNVNVYRMTEWSGSEGASTTAATAKYVMVPQLDSTLDQAILGTDITPDDNIDNKKPCIDAGGSLVCSIYRIVVQNTGSAAITVEGSLNFYASTAGNKDNTSADKIGAAGDNIMNHLKWARLTQPSTVVDKSYTYADVSVIDNTEGQYHKTMPTTLLSYANTLPADGETKGYQVTPDNQIYAYQDVSTDLNKYLYAMEVTTTETVVGEGNNAVTTSHIDLLGAYDESITKNYKVTGTHGKYTDLIDPTGDLTVTFENTNKTATAVKNDADKNGKWYLAAKDQAGDTKVFYIVVWISENEQRQNDVDFGQFTGTVTFQSSEGSGASSTFTETAQG